MADKHHCANESSDCTLMQSFRQGPILLGRVPKSQVMTTFLFVKGHELGVAVAVGLHGMRGVLKFEIVLKKKCSQRTSTVIWIGLDEGRAVATHDGRN